MRNEATVASQSEVVQWLRDGLVTSDLDDSIESLAGRAIGSLCGQKLMVKIEAGSTGLPTLNSLVKAGGILFKPSKACPQICHQCSNRLEMNGPS